MKYDISTYDTKDAIADDRNHLWHHISQHKVLEEKDPLMIVEGKGMRVWDANGKEHLDAVSGAALFNKTDAALFRRTDAALFRKADGALFRKTDAARFRWTDAALFRGLMLLSS